MIGKFASKLQALLLSGTRSVRRLVARVERLIKWAC